MSSSIWDMTVTDIEGQSFTLDRYRNQVLLVVNVASRCVYTPQYRRLDHLFLRHRNAGFVILGFPCNQFGAQEPGSAAEIAAFCRTTYGVSFPMFSRIDVNGPRAHPLYRFLTAQKRGLLGTRAIKWNFTKFLIDRTGRVVERFGPAVAPDAIEPAVVACLVRPDREADR